MGGMSFPGVKPGMSVVVHREGYAACFKLPIHNFWEYLGIGRGAGVTRLCRSGRADPVRDGPLRARGS